MFWLLKYFSEEGIARITALVGRPDADEVIESTGYKVQQSYTLNYSVFYAKLTCYIHKVAFRIHPVASNLHELHCLNSVFAT